MFTERNGGYTSDQLAGTETPPREGDLMDANGHPMGVRSKEQQAPVTDIATHIGASIGTVLAVVVIGFVVAAPFAWLLMLFLGNLGLTDVTFWDCLPGGGLFGVLVAGRVKA